MKKDIFDEIIEHLQELQSQSKTTYIASEIVNEFFKDSLSAPVTTPIQVQNTAPAVFSAESMDPAIASMTLDQLNLNAQNCKKCPLCANRKNVVFGEGSPNADLMFIGESPRAEEDQQGRHFVGKAGELLAKMITAMQFTKEEVYITNIIKCHPPKNRNPLPKEAEVCMHYLQRQIELIKPKVIVTLGAVPFKYLLNKTGLMRLRGQWDTYKGIKVMPTFHPAYLVREPKAKAATWNDLQQVMNLFNKVHKK